MMDYLQHIIDWLNDNAGIVSFFALLAAIFVPWRIYRKNRMNQLQDSQDELDSMNESGGTMTADERKADIRKRTLKKHIERGL